MDSEITECEQRIADFERKWMSIENDVTDGNTKAVVAASRELTREVIRLRLAFENRSQELNPKK
jgi:hypothetical protein